MHLQKILVIGASIAGPSLCYWLKRHGFRPTLIEKFPEVRTGGQALDIRGVAVGLTQQMGIYDEICAMRTTVERGRYVDASGQLLHEEHGEKFGFRQDDEVEIIRGDLVKILMSRIQDVPCYFNRSVVHFKERDMVEVQFNDGHIEDFDVVIGADGIHSTTRNMVFHKDEYQIASLGSYLCIFTIPNYLNLKQTELICEADQKMVSITSDKNSNEAQAAFMFRSPEILSDIRNKHEHMKFLRRTFAHFGWEIEKIFAYMPQSKDFYFDAITQVFMKSWSKGRVALVGDAGYCPSPLSGQGNNLAMVGAYILAGELKNAQGNYQTAFARYYELMHDFVTSSQKFGQWVSASFLAPQEVSQQIVEQRMDETLKSIKIIANAITLPTYTT